MLAIHLDSSLADDERRARLFGGHVFLFSARPSIEALRAFARGLIEEAFGPLDPREAQHVLPVEKFVEIVAPLKPLFVHHPESKRLIRDLVADLGADPEATYFDVPRMRVVTADGYLTAGVGHQLDAHRDTWWSAPFAQLNWWSPIYDIDDTCSMSFFPHYWQHRLANTSRIFNYYEWNAVGRAAAATQIAAETRKTPEPEERVQYDPQLRFVVPPGGLVLFSGAQLHATAPNTSGRTRFSFDFRTVDLDDLVQRRSAPNVDSACTGTSLRDFKRVTDLAPLPEDVVETYDSGERPEGGVLVYQPDVVAAPPTPAGLG